MYSSVEKVFGDTFGDYVPYKRKKRKRFDSDGTNVLYGSDWTKEMGIQRKVLPVDGDKRSNLVDNISICGVAQW